MTEADLKSEDLSLLNLISIIIKNFKIIILVTLITTLIGLTYSYFKPEELSKASLEIKNIDNRSYSEFLMINKTIDTLEFAEEIPALSSEFEPWLTRDSLRKSFIEEFVDYSILKENLFKMFKSKNDVHSNDLLGKVSSYAGLFGITESKNKLESDYVVFYFKKDDKEMLISTLDQTIKDINKVVHQNIEEASRKVLEIINLNTRRNISKLKEEILSEKANFISKHNQKIAYLEEQYQIAKSLDIKESIDVDSSILASLDNNNYEDEDMSYLLGYDAIQSQLNILNSRDLLSIELYSNDYAELVSLLREAESQASSKYFLEAIDSLPRVENFKAVSINTEFIEFEYAGNNYIAIIFGFLVGLFLSVMYFVYRDFYKEKITI